MTRVHAATGCLLVLTSCVPEGRVVGTYGGEGGGYYGGGCSFDCGFGGENLGAYNQGGYPADDAPACYEDSAALVFDPAVVGPVEINQGLCTATQITDVFDACVGEGSSEALCDAFTATAPENQACLDCVVGGGPQPFPMPVTIAGKMVQYLSRYACMAEVLGLPECEIPFQNLLFCGSTACEGCNPEVDYEYWDCVNYAINDPEVCGAIEVPESCDPLFTAQELPPECIGNASTFDAAFAIMADFYCGAP